MNTGNSGRDVIDCSRRDARSRMERTGPMNQDFAGFRLHFIMTHKKRKLANFSSLLCDTLLPVDSIDLSFQDRRVSCQPHVTSGFF